jgi:hypothetical protein
VTVRSLTLHAIRRVAARFPSAREGIGAVGATVLPALLVTLAGFNAGGFSAVAQGWIGLTGALVGAVVVLVVGPPHLTTLNLVFLAAFGGFATWLALSNIWSASVPSTMLEVQRCAAYFGLLVGATAIVRSHQDAGYLAAGALSGAVVVCAYGVLTRLAPDRFGRFDSVTAGYRLYTPITYWNGLGILAVVGLLAALAFSARASRVAGRSLAASTVPLLSLAALFTYSRGAWIALLVAVAFGILIDPRRLQLIGVQLAVLPASAAILLVASRSRGLTKVRTPLRLAVTEGHRVLAWLVVATVASALASCLYALVERGWSPPRGVRRFFGSTLAVGVIVGCSLAIRAWGAPWTYPSRAWSAFGGWSSTPPTDVQTRLFQLSGTGRLYLWRVAWHAFQAEPLRGNGAGTFWELWLRHRTIGLATSQAHNLYVQVLAELGTPGFVLLVSFVSVPLIASIRYRHIPLVPPLAAAYVAWAVHLSVDWDWQLPAVSAVPLLIGLAVVSAGGKTLRPRTLPAAGAAIVVAVLAGWLLVGSIYMRRASQEASSAQFTAAHRDARRAELIEPWASEPHMIEARILTASGRVVPARAEFATAIQKDPSNWELWAELGIISRGEAKARAEDHVRALLASP